MFQERKTESIQLVFRIHDICVDPDPRIHASD